MNEIISDITWKHRFIIDLQGLQRRTALHVKNTQFNIVSKNGHIEFYDTNDTLGDLLKLRTRGLDMSISFITGEGACFKKFKFKEVNINNHCFICDYTDPETCAHRLEFSFSNIDVEVVK